MRPGCGGEKLGFYGLEAGVALAAVGNVVVTSSLLIASILALYRSDIVRKERETALMRSEHFNRTINEASPDCVSLLDADGNVVFSNDAALRAYGLDDLAELVGRPWGHRLDERSRVDVQVAIAAAREGRVGRLTIGLPGPDGGLCWYESLVSKLDDSDSQPITFIIMSRDITHQKGVEDQVRWAATHDALTRLPNRALFQTRLEQVVAAGGRPQFALLVLDVDHFKQVNDMLGHDAGDALLSTVATRLCNSVRKQDFVARLGGDEFAIILSDIRAES
ncbi:MAG: diguanylate cyclase [Sphingomonas sp.]|nr:diguanylate cyclase [Sphingomonas sp.]